MTEVNAVFRSRTQAVECNGRLRASGVPSALVNTPKEAGVGCGLSVKVPQNLLPRARQIIARGNFAAFYGFITMKKY